MTNDRGLILEHFILFSPDGATIFYWAMSVIGIGVLFLSVHLAIESRLYPRRISLSEHAASIPKSRWSSRVTSIPYATISDMGEIKLRGARLLYITHAGGRATVNSALFKTEEDYGPFCQSLMERVNALQRKS